MPDPHPASRDAQGRPGPEGASVHALPARTVSTPTDELFRHMVETTSEHAMLLLDPTGRVQSWNAGAERIKGYAAAEIIGESFKRFYPEEAIAVGHPERELELAALTGRFEEEGWRVRKDGSRFWARVVISGVFDDEGTLLAYSKVTRDLTEARQRQEQLENVLTLLEQTIRIDNLTGLPNRRAWDERLVLDRARAERSGEPLVVAVLDLDHFKRVNDERGHAAGDALLKQCALRWRRAIRPTDLLARYGGEEFAAALPGCDQASATVVLERLRVNTPGAQTCSIGLAEWDGRESLDALFSRTDRAMYEAKQAGRNRIAAA